MFDRAKISRKTNEIKYFKQWAKNNPEEFKKYSRAHKLYMARFS